VVASRAESPAEERRDLDKEWWLRTLFVLVAPRATFAALRDDSDAAAQARQEPLLAVVWLAGIAGVLSTNAAARILDDFEVTGILVAVWAFLAGGLYGAVLYLVVGMLVHLGADFAGSMGSFRRSRHLVGLAAVPLALALVVWPVRVAIYGSDLFETGGSDHGPGNAFFEALELVFLAWALALLVLGVRTVHGWTWPRALAATAVPAIVPVLVVLRSFGAI
jgi:hypothetical protein